MNDCTVVIEDKPHIMSFDLAVGVGALVIALSLSVTYYETDSCTRHVQSNQPESLLFCPFAFFFKIKITLIMTTSKTEVII